MGFGVEFGFGWPPSPGRLRQRLRRTRRSYQRKRVTGERLLVLLDSLAGEVHVGGELLEAFEVGLELFLVRR